MRKSTNSWAFYYNLKGVSSAFKVWCADSLQVPGITKLAMSAALGWIQS